MSDLMMREATLQDYNSYYKIKCDPKNVEWSGFSCPPDNERLRARFETFFQDENQGLLLFESEGEIIGYVNFFFTEDGESIETSHGALSDNTVKGLGYKMLKETIQFIDNSDSFNCVDSFIGWVAESNFASLQNVIKNGYQPTGKTENRQLVLGCIKFIQYKKERGNNE